MKKKVLLLLIGVLILGLAMTGVALASKANPASPQDIYNDFADNHKLDGSYFTGADKSKFPYTVKELQAFLRDPGIHQYGDTSVTGPADDAVNKELGRDEFPLTGFQLMIAGIIAVVLVAGGVLLRRLSRPQKS